LPGGVDQGNALNVGPLVQIAVELLLRRFGLGSQAAAQALHGVFTRMQGGAPFDGVLGGESAQLFLALVANVLPGEPSDPRHEQRREDGNAQPQPGQAAVQWRTHAGCGVGS
jgi:hypothetical protein